eukprot:5473523-Pleurochrysis_carterae.AAC.1
MDAAIDSAAASKPSRFVSDSAAEASTRSRLRMLSAWKRGVLTAPGSVASCTSWHRRVSVDGAPAHQRLDG